MKVQEANEIIAKYMGLEFVNGCVWWRYGCPEAQILPVFSQSLDALIPPLEKYWRENPSVKLMQISFGKKPCVSFVSGFDRYVDHIEDECKTVCETACVSTARAIEELK